MERIDPAQWKRKPICDFFAPLEIPFYAVTFRVDATALVRRAKEQGGGLFYHTVYAVMQAVNGVDAFLYKLRGDQVVRHQYLSPSFTAPAEEDLFKIVTLDFDPREDALAFCRRARARTEAQTELFPPAAESRDDVAYLTCLPWLDFTSLTNEMPLNRADSIPRFGWGRTVEEGGRITMAFSVEVNHRLIDGKHIGLFAQALQQRLDGTK